MSDSTQNNRGDKVVANQGGPQYANDGNVYENTGTGTQNNASGHAHVNSGGTGNVFVGGYAGDTATTGGRIYKRKFRFSPFLLFGHAAKAHPVASLAITLIVGAGAVTGGYVLTQAKAPTPRATTLPSAATASASASTGTVIPVPAPESDGSWPQLGGGPARTGYQPGETRIGSGNVTKLTLKRTYQPTAGSDGVSAPLIANGILYVDSGGLLDAFDATGATGCVDIPTTCTALWTAPTAGFQGMTVADGKVFITDNGGVQAFDAAGTTNCSGTPKVCAALWTTSASSSTGFLPGPGSPVVVNGVLYVPGYGDGVVPSQGGAYVAAFDPAGSAGCSGTPVVCDPMWTTTGVSSGDLNDGSPAIANGVIYIASGSTLYAFDATESAACSGTPKTCASLWTATLSDGGATTVAVAGGLVYVGTEDGDLYAFNAAGTTNCSTLTTLKTCAPLWTAPVNADTLAVANGVVYAATNGTLDALDATAPGNCPGTGATRTCTLAPLWTSANSTYVDTETLTVANGVVYTTSSGGGIDAYDAAGSLSCSVSGTVKECTPLWQDVPGYTSGGSPVIADGVLFISAPGNGDVYAFSS
jgi:hypothetical protein